MELLRDRIETPLGPMVAAGDAAAVRLLEFDRGDRPARSFARLERRLGGLAIARGDSEAIRRLRAELAAYFAGDGVGFQTPVALSGTPFERAVWEELRGIPRGQTRSYAQIARRLGQPGASRAVGRANGANSLAILVPCHRVTRSGGALGGYAGGLARKRWLLEHEQRVSGATLFG